MLGCHRCPLKAMLTLPQPSLGKKSLIPLSALFSLFLLLCPCKSSRSLGGNSAMSGPAARQILSLHSPRCSPPWQVPWGIVPGVWGHHPRTGGQREAGEAQLPHKLFFLPPGGRGWELLVCFSWSGINCSPEVTLWSLNVKGSTFLETSFIGLVSCLQNISLFLS